MLFSLSEPSRRLTDVKSNPMSKRNVSESMAAYEAGFIALIWRPDCMA